MTVGLVMIVKNEEKVIPRLAESLRGKIDYYTIVDTGSTDDTMNAIDQLFEAEGQLIEQPWKGFGPSRNDALEAAEGKTDWMLTLDADETLEGNIEELPDCDAIEAEMHYGNLRYWRAFLIRSGRGWQWQGRAHEALVKDSPHIEQTHSFYVQHHADGGTRGNKFERDIELLHQDWEENPNPRTAFYLARTYEDVGDVEEARDWYASRLSMGGWSEEIFYSLYRLGRLWGNDMGVGMLWRAWAMRPHRTEPLLALCEIYRLQANWELAWHAAWTALNAYTAIGVTSDLFVDADACWKIHYELSISGWYTHHRDVGRRSMHRLLKLDLPEPYRTSVQTNASFYEEQS